jgi:hypothetical protein
MTGGLRGRRQTSRALRRALGVLVVTPALVLSTLASAPATGAMRWTLRDPFSREVVRPGDVDTDPYHIEHVYEVQYRLERLGLFDAVPNGHSGRSPGPQSSSSSPRSASPRPAPSTTRPGDR